MVATINKTIIIMMIMTFGFFISPATPVYAVDDVFVIANTVFLNGNQLSYSEIEDIFTLRNKKWKNGTLIRVFVLSRSNPRTKEFASKYLNMSANRYFDIIENRESLGKGNIADIIASEHGIMLKVLTTPGSIGYASDSIVVNFNDRILIVK